METQKRKMCIVKEVQIVMKIIIMQIQENMEMQYTRRARAVVVLHRGTTITLTFLARAILSSFAEALTIMVWTQACSVSYGSYDGNSYGNSSFRPVLAAL